MGGPADARVPDLHVPADAPGAVLGIPSQAGRRGLTLPFLPFPETRHSSRPGRPGIVVTRGLFRFAGKDHRSPTLPANSARRHASPDHRLAAATRPSQRPPLSQPMKAATLAHRGKAP